MTVSRRLCHLPAFFLALSWAYAVAVSAADAKGSAPKPDFTMSVFTGGWDWAELTGGPVGSFESTGVINDFGDVYYLFSYNDAAGNLWRQCLFVGFFGLFETALPARPENGGEYPFELSKGTEDYLGLNAVGVATARTKKGFVWYDDPSTFKQKWTYLDVSWTMKWFLHP